MLYKYGDFINKGRSNKALHLDDDWIIKSPLKKDEKMPEDYDPDETMKDIINDFDRHIKFMQKYPNIFPEVKKLDKYRAAIQKVDLEKANNEINYVHSTLLTNEIIDEHLSNYSFLYYVYAKMNKYVVANDIIHFLKNCKDDVCIKWYNFIVLLDKEIKPELGFLFDLYPRNIGLDKQGNIKLIDF